MHLKTLLPALLASSAVALPRIEKLARADAPSPTPSLIIHTTDGGEQSDGDQMFKPSADDEEICGMEFNEGDSEVVADTWEGSGAETFLYEFLEENGEEDWVGNMFRATVADGEQGGSTYDCTNFPAEGSCTCPGHNLCVEYTPVSMFFVHLSICHLYSALIRLHEDMQDHMIVDLANGIKEIVEVFGPPPPPEDNSFILTLLIGGFVSGAALATKHWQVGSPMTAMVGILNIAAGMVAAGEEPETPADFEHDLEKSLGKFYSDFAENLKDAVNAIFGGDFSAFEDMEVNPVDFITDGFAEGKMLDYKLINPAVDAWIDGAKSMIVWHSLTPNHFWQSAL